jgi:hypothetical protein
LLRADGNRSAAIPVSMDAAPFEAFTVAVDEQAKEVVN